MFRLLVRSFGIFGYVVNYADFAELQFSQLGNNVEGLCIQNLNCP